MSFYYNSALTTFKVREGEYFSLPMQKSIFLIFYKLQNEMNKNFKSNLKNLLSFSIQKDFLSEAVSKVYCRKEKDIPFSWINPNLNTDNTEFNEITENNFQLYLSHIRNISKTSTIKEYCQSQSIDITEIANVLNIRINSLKKLFLSVQNTKLDFNYINKKKLDISFSSYVLKNISFNKSSFKSPHKMNFEVPKEIISLLLIPESYSKLNKNFILNFKKPYSIRMYKLFEDHMKKKKVELTKKELFNFLNLGTSYNNKTNLEKRILNPVFDELEKLAGIKVETEVYPKNNWETITFSLTRVPILSEDEEIQTNLEKINSEITQSSIFSSKVSKAVEKMRRNIFVSRSWNPSIEKTISKLFHSEGEEFCVKVLNNVYENLKTPLRRWISIIMLF